METLLLLLLVLAASALAQEDAFIGVNIGTNPNTMPSPSEVVELLKAHQINHIKLYNADANMLIALANTSIKVAISIPNNQIIGIAQSNSSASKWVYQNVLQHYPNTNITTICVGIDVLTNMPNASLFLTNALKNIHLALVASNLDKKIQVTTPISSSIITNPFPPSQAVFNRSLNPVLVPLLKFLQNTSSIFMINHYPYNEYVQSENSVSLDYALLNPTTNNQTIDMKTNLHYSNGLDAMVDAAYFAMATLNITGLPVIVSETGWPSKSSADETYATPDNARLYNTNLVKHVLNRTGTPKHPGIAVCAYIYELYDDGTKQGTLSEQRWGLFRKNGEPNYSIQFSSSESGANQSYCTAKKGADAKMLQAALDWACGAGKVDCSALMQGQPCYEPDTVDAHAMYAFNSYYQQMGKAAGSCDFNGVAEITYTSPSHGSCSFSGIESGKNGSRLNSTVPEMDSESSFSSAGLRYGCGVGFSPAKVVIGFVGSVALLF